MLGYALAFCLNFCIRHRLLTLGFSHFLVFLDEVTERYAKVIDCLQRGFARYLEEFEHGEDVVGAVVERSCCEQHYLVTHTQVVKYAVILNVFVLVFVGFVDDNKELLIVADNHPIVIQRGFNLAATEYGCSETELVPVLFPLLFKMRRTDNDCAQVKIPCNGRCNDTFTKANNVCNDDAVVVFDGFHGHLNSI